MELLIAVFAGFVLALATPWLQRPLGRWLGWFVALLPAAIAVYFGQMAGTLVHGQARIAHYDWVPELGLALSFYLDGLSLLFVLLIAGIGALVAVYAGGYLQGNARLGLFYSYLLVFMGAMLGLVLAGNLLTLYVFWELTTLSSFLLIGFENEREAARTAALQSLLVTALGGLALMAGLILLGMAGGSFELADLLDRGETIRGHATYEAIFVLVLLGACTKSAQFPFYFWLPNAMQAPTPVSAYLHSATMVKAGIYLLARLLPVLGGTTLWHASVTGIGAITMLAGAYLACYQHNLKAILAYLTVNALGTLTLLLGLGSPLAVKAAIVFLTAHALYKGALFMAAGAVEHETHTRDIRELGGLWMRMPATAVAGVLAGLSMAGVIPLFGFIGKELYFEAVWQAPTFAWSLTLLAGFAGALVVMSAALVVVVPFFGASTSHASGVHEASPSIWIGPLLLAASGLGVGLYPHLVAAPLQDAVSNVLGEPATVKLSLWHGFTPPLALSVAVLMAGAALFAARRRVANRLEPSQRLLRWGPEAWYDRALAGMLSLAAWQTRQLQHGYLRVYVAVTVAVLVGLVGLTISHVGLEFVWRASLELRFYEAVAVLLVVLGALVTVTSTSRFRAVAALGVVGLSASWIYSLFGAPDLAMTQVVVEVVTVLLFVLVFYHLPAFTIGSSKTTRFRDAVLALTAGAATTVLLLLVTNLSDIEPVSQFYAQESYRAAHGRNVVNVILVDFRALDTLGELTVLTAAAIGVLSLFKLALPRKGAE